MRKTSTNWLGRVPRYIKGKKAKWKWLHIVCYPSVKEKIIHEKVYMYLIICAKEKDTPETEEICYQIYEENYNDTYYKSNYSKPVIKGKIWKAMREKKTSYVQNNEAQDERLLIRKHARKTVNTIFQVLKRKNCQPRISTHSKNLSKTKVK